MKKEIYHSSGVRKDIYDDDYVFFDDGTIEHHYDKHETDANRVEGVTADKIPERRKVSIIKDCPEEIKETIEKMLKVE